MPVSRTAADPARPPRPARKERADGTTEGAALQLGELSELLGYSLKRAQLKVFEDFLRCVAPLQLTPAQFSVLLLLDRNPGRNQTEIASTLGILRPNFVAMLDGLESRDLCYPDAFGQRSPLPYPGPDRQGPGGAGARQEAGRHQARGASQRAAGPHQPRRAAGDAGDHRPRVLTKVPPQ